MSQHWRSPESDDEEADENDVHLTGRDVILFLVDCSESMFQSANPEKEQRSKFRITIECIEAVMRNRIIMSDTDLVGRDNYDLDTFPDLHYNIIYSPSRSASFSTTLNTVQTVACPPT